MEQNDKYCIDSENINLQLANQLFHYGYNHKRRRNRNLGG